MTVTRHCAVKRRWLVLAGSCILYVISFGIAQSFGLLYAEILRYFNAGKGETGWIPSLNLGLLFGLAPVASLIEKKFGCRVVSMTGSVLIAAGLLSSMFVNDMYLLYLTYGIITDNANYKRTAVAILYSGLKLGKCYFWTGNGLIMLTANEVINQNFDKQCRLAFGIASAGGSVGVVVIPILVAYWLDVYGWRGTFTMMSGLGLQGVVCAAIFPSVSNKKNTEKEEDSENKNNPSSFKEQMKKILASRQFHVFNISTTIACLGYLVPYIIVPDVAISRGLTSYQSALVITSAGIAGIVAKVFTGWIAQFDHINTLSILGIVLLIGTGWSVACVYISSVGLFLVYGVFLGIYIGIFGALQTVTLVEILDKELFSLAYGILCFFHGIAFAIGPPIAGWIADISGSYNGGFYFTAAVLFVACLLLFLIPIDNLCCKNSTKKYNCENVT